MWVGGVVALWVELSGAAYMGVFCWNWTVPVSGSELPWCLRIVLLPYVSLSVLVRECGDFFFFFFFFFGALISIIRSKLAYFAMFLMLGCGRFIVPKMVVSVIVISGTKEIRVFLYGTIFLLFVDWIHKLSSVTIRPLHGLFCPWIDDVGWWGRRIMSWTIRRRLYGRIFVEDWTVPVSGSELPWCVWELLLLPYVSLSVLVIECRDFFFFYYGALISVIRSKLMHFSMFLTLGRGRFVVP